jgi:hypothetical protein
MALLATPPVLPHTLQSLLLMSLHPCTLPPHLPTPLMSLLTPLLSTLLQFTHLQFTHLQFTHLLSTLLQFTLLLQCISHHPHTHHLQFTRLRWCPALLQEDTRTMEKPPSERRPVARLRRRSCSKQAHLRRIAPTAPGTLQELVPHNPAGKASGG